MIDQNYTSSPSPDAYKQRQAEFNNLSSTLVKGVLFKCSYALYEQGDKSSKLLAHELRQKSSAHQILKINTHTQRHYNWSISFSLGSVKV